MVFDISYLHSGGMTAGSIEGAGAYFLGSKSLTVGGNNLSTEVSGIIADGGFNGGTGGLLVKVGSGTLLLSGGTHLQWWYAPIWIGAQPRQYTNDHS
jgi:hypothetical protein